MSAKTEKLFKNPLQESDQLYFIHVPKCAGTSFISLVDEHYIFDEICPTHYDIKKLKNEISDEQLQAYRFIRGHLPYDMVIPRLKKTPRVLTFLREPVTRLISNFEMRQRLSDPLVGMQARLQGVDLDQFMQEADLVAHFANRATRLIGGEVKMDSGKVVPNLEQAKARMASFDFVGIVENFDEALEQFAYTYHFPPMQARRELNVSPNREKRAEISPETLQRVAEMEYADIELYQFGVQLFGQQRQRMAAEKSQGLDVIPLGSQERVDFDFSRVNPGEGWHLGESNDTYKVVRWSGPDKVSFLRFAPMPVRDYRIRIQVVYAAASHLLPGLVVEVNGNPVQLKSSGPRGGFPVVLEGRIPAASLVDGAQVIVAFKIPETIVPTEANSQEKRLLGLCYNWLKIDPL